jgi:nucleoside-diphosphate-sugar epimerase
MRVFVAGSSGAIGRLLVPELVKEGHSVTALVRSAARAEILHGTGAHTVVADPLDRTALTSAVTSTKPDAIIHQLTALAHAGNFKKLDEEFALTNRFRTEVTDTLIAAGRAIRIRRLIAQSFCGWPYSRTGGPVKDEEDPLDPNPPAAFRQTLAAIRHLEAAVADATDINAVALRYGLFYGPGTGFAKDGTVTDLVRKRRMPIVGNGGGIWSFIHVQDAVSATIAALARGAPGIYNVVDDEPAPVSSWLPYLADVLGAKPPRRIPAWIAKLVIGDGGVSMMTQIRGGSNTKAKRGLDWRPAYETWRRGFVNVLG